MQNSVKDIESYNIINITTEETNVNVTQPITNVVQVVTQGPQGPVGPAGPSLNTGSFVLTSSFNNFTSSYNTGSFTGSFTGEFNGTSIARTLYSFSGTGTVSITPSVEEYVLFHNSAPAQIEQGILSDVNEGYSRFIAEIDGIYEITYRLCIVGNNGNEIVSIYLVNTTNPYLQQIVPYNDQGLLTLNKNASTQQYYTETIQLSMLAGDAFSVAVYTEDTEVALKGFVGPVVRSSYGVISIKFLGTIQP